MDYYVGKQLVSIDLNSLEKIGGGQESDIFHYRKSLLLKLFKDDRPGFLKMNSELRLKTLRKLRNQLKLAVVPLKLVYDSSHISVIGYTMREFLNLVPLYQLQSLYLLILIKKIRDFEHEVMIMSEHVRFQDLKTDSIFYSTSSQKLCLLDCSGFLSLSVDYCEENALVENLKEINRLLFYKLFWFDENGSMDMVRRDFPDIYDEFENGAFLSDILEYEMRRTGCLTLKKLKRYYKNEKRLCYHK